MYSLKRLLIGVALIMTLGLGVSVSAQGVDDTLAAGEPASVEIAQAGQS
ncbi:MAG: hypothetical protein IH587_14780, partial [Anaerolineae bacterium]|nr:hypothetical protein [Anaerolineae bacterium]